VVNHTTGGQTTHFFRINRKKIERTKKKSSLRDLARFSSYSIRRVLSNNEENITGAVRSSEVRMYFFKIFLRAMLSINV